MWLLFLNVLLVPIGAVLWFLGGCGDECDLPLKLNKAWRRYVWPTYAGLVCLVNGAPWWTVAKFSGSMMVANSLGYGEKHNWYERAVTGFLLGIPMWFMVHTWIWPVATLATFVPLYWLSRRYNWFTWPVVEASTGAVQGACVVTILTLKWLAGMTN